MKIDEPDMSVINDAIDLINYGISTYSCVALALSAKMRKKHSADVTEYMRQYSMVICGVDSSRIPYWWNMANSREKFKKARIRALIKFRQACIDAAKRDSA